jgi:hypothetical protein
MPALPFREDITFVGSACRAGYRLRHPLDVQVTVSARLDGRAIGGMSDCLKAWMAAEESGAPHLVEDPQAIIVRLRHLNRQRAGTVRFVEESENNAHFSYVGAIEGAKSDSEKSIEVELAINQLEELIADNESKIYVTGSSTMDLLQSPVWSGREDAAARDRDGLLPERVFEVTEVAVGAKGPQRQAWPFRRKSLKATDLGGRSFQRKIADALLLRGTGISGGRRFRSLMGLAVPRDEHVCDSSLTQRWGIWSNQFRSRVIGTLFRLSRLLAQGSSCVTQTPQLLQPKVWKYPQNPRNLDVQALMNLPLFYSLTVGFAGAAMYLFVDRYERDAAIAALLKFLVFFVGSLAILHKLKPFGIQWF